jgi:hypothetical protein
MALLFAAPAPPWDGGITETWAPLHPVGAPFFMCWDENHPGWCQGPQLAPTCEDYGFPHCPTNRSASEAQRVPPRKCKLSTGCSG